MGKRCQFPLGRTGIGSHLFRTFEITITYSRKKFTETGTLPLLYTCRISVPPGKPEHPCNLF